MMIVAWCLSNWKLVAVGVLVAILGAYGVTMRTQRDIARAEYSDFRREIAVAAQAAAEQALKRTIADEKRKEESDAAHAKTVATLTDSIGRLRLERDDARSRFLPPTAAAPDRPDLACFDRAEYLGAYRDLVSEVRGPADEGTAATVDLDAAKGWATSR